MEIAGSEGLYVTGGISEIFLPDKVKPGQTVSVSSWRAEQAVRQKLQKSKLSVYR